jgi:hypothetical protein
MNEASQGWHSFFPHAIQTKKYKLHSICAYLPCARLPLVIHGKWQNSRERER